MMASQPVADVARCDADMDRVWIDRVYKTLSHP
jgi:hypothetical protein